MYANSFVHKHNPAVHRTVIIQMSVWLQAWSHLTLYMSKSWNIQIIQRSLSLHWDS